MLDVSCCSALRHSNLNKKLEASFNSMQTICAAQNRAEHTQQPP